MGIISPKIRKMEKQIKSSGGAICLKVVGKIPMPSKKSRKRQFFGRHRNLLVLDQ